MTTPKPAEATNDPPQEPVDLRADGLLWLINRSVFHPRGYALALDPDTNDFYLLGDGSEPWDFAPGIADKCFTDVINCLARVATANAVASDKGAS